MTASLRLLRLLSPLACGALALAVAGCLGGDSSEDIVREVGINVAGVYSNGGSPMVGQNTGKVITSLNLRQFGDRLEGTDNNGINFVGTIGRESGSGASFTLEGRTTAGAKGFMVGNIEVSGTSATMRGTWAEDAISSAIFATATVAGSTGGGGGSTGLSISPSSATLTGVDSSSFTASGGTAPYSWTVSSASLGSVSPTSGSSTTYTSSGTNGTQTITVTDSSGGTRSATITQN